MLLAIDTSTSYIGIAVYDGNSILGEETWMSINRHTVVLAPAVKQLFTNIEIVPSDIKVTAVALGPGSFTSLRVGMAFAKGFALGNKIPVLGIPTFDIVSLSQPVKSKPMITILPAGRGRFAISTYTAQNKKWITDHVISVVTIDDLIEKITVPTIICGEIDGDSAVALRKGNKNILLTSPILRLRRPGYLADTAWKIWKKGDYPDGSTLSPIYLHSKDPIPDQKPGYEFENRDS